MGQQSITYKIFYLQKTANQFLNFISSTDVCMCICIWYCIIPLQRCWHTVGIPEADGVVGLVQQAVPANQLVYEYTKQA